MKFYADVWIDGKNEKSALMSLEHCLSWLRLSVCDEIGGLKKAKRITDNIRKQFTNETNTARCGWQDSSIMVFFDVIRDDSL